MEKQIFQVFLDTDGTPFIISRYQLFAIGQRAGEDAFKYLEKHGLEFFEDCPAIEAVDDMHAWQEFEKWEDEQWDDEWSAILEDFPDILEEIKVVTNDLLEYNKKHSIKE